MTSLSSETESVSIPQRIINWVKNHPTQLTALIFWTIVILGTRQYMQVNDLTFPQLVRQLSDILTGTWYGPLLYILVYLLRPLILFPASLLTILAGNVFGLAYGFVYALIAGTASSAIPYSVGRWFSTEEEAKEEVLEDEDESRLKKFVGLLRKNPFQAVLTMRFLFLPYDGVSLLAGALRIGLIPFFLATALGNIGGTFAFVSAGASIEGDISTGDVSIDATTLGIAITIFVVSLVISRVLNKYQSDKEENDNSAQQATAS